MLKSSGITSFNQLAETELVLLQKLLSEAEFTLADPGTWAEQARLAANGNWKEFHALKEELKWGKVVVEDEKEYV